MVEPTVATRVVGRVASGVIGAQGRGLLPPRVTEVAAPHPVEWMHPDTDDPTLAPWFVVAVTEPADAEAIASRLRALPEVDAAYVEPLSAAPA
jgi:hypothetical protein